MELQRTIPAATKRVLTQQLNELEKMGVVYKKSTLYYLHGWNII